MIGWASMLTPWAAPQPVTSASRSSWPAPRSPSRIDVLAYVDRGVSWPDDAQPAPRRPSCAGDRSCVSRSSCRCAPGAIYWTSSRWPTSRRRARRSVCHGGPRPVVKANRNLSVRNPTPTRVDSHRRARSAAVGHRLRFTRARLIDGYDLRQARPPRPLRRRSAMAAHCEMRRRRAESLDLPGRFVLAVGRAAPRKNSVGWSRRSPGCAPQKATSASCWPGLPRQARPSRGSAASAMSATTSCVRCTRLPTWWLTCRCMKASACRCWKHWPAVRCRRQRHHRRPRSGRRRVRPGRARECGVDRRGALKGP